MASSGSLLTLFRATAPNVGKIPVAETAQIAVFSLRNAPSASEAAVSFGLPPIPRGITGGRSVSDEERVRRPCREFERSQQEGCRFGRGRSPRSDRRRTEVR